MPPLAVVADADACIPQRIRLDLGILTAPLEAPLLERDEALPVLRREGGPVPTEAIAVACRQAAASGGPVLLLSANPAVVQAAHAAGEAAGIALRALEAPPALMGCGWQAVAAALAARGGSSPDEAEHAARLVGERVRVLLAVEHPQLLGVASGFGATFLRSRAIVELTPFGPEVLERSGRRDTALVRLRERFAETAGSGGLLRVAVHHAAAAAAAEAMARWVEQMLHPEEVVLAPLTRHAAAAFGPGMVGFAWYREPA